MPRKVIGYDGFVDLFRNLQKKRYCRIAVRQRPYRRGRREARKAFYEIANDFGMPHIHTLKVVPEDDRPPYWVHVSNLKWE